MQLQKWLINVLALKLAMLKAGRKSPEFHCLSYSSSEEALKKWISGDRDRDLVLSRAFMNGYEHSVIIDTTATFDGVESRCSSKLIKMYPNTFCFCVETHCEVMSLSEEQLGNINLSLSDLLGEF